MKNTAESSVDGQAGLLPLLYFAYFLSFFFLSLAFSLSVDDEMRAGGFCKLQAPRGVGGFFFITRIVAVSVSVSPSLSLCYIA